MTQGQIIMAIIALVNAWALLVAKAWWDKRAAAVANPAVNQPNITKPEGNVRVRSSRSVLVSRMWLFLTYWTAGWLSLSVILNISSDLLKGSALTSQSVVMMVVSAAVLFSSNNLLWRTTPAHSTK